MKFSQFLNEQYRTVIDDIEEAKELLKKHCSHADFGAPIWRGTKLHKDIQIVDGSKGFRKSVEGSNHYTVILDHYLKSKKLPMRSKSIICASYTNRDHAAVFGKMNAIFPYDEAQIGIVPAPDIWDVKSEYKNTEYSFKEWNDNFVKMNVPDTSYEDIINYIEKELINDPDYFEGLFTSGRVKNQIDEIYNINDLMFKFTTGKEFWNSPLYSARELWISGPCISISEGIWKELKKEGFKLK